MYQRSIDNVTQLLAYDQLVDQHQQTLKEQEQLKNQLLESENHPQKPRPVFLLFAVAAFLAGGLLTYFLVNYRSNINEPAPAQHPLSDYFDFDFDSDIAFASPYLKPSEVQHYCPGSAYEGRWSLDQPYKLPLPHSKPGLYYLAKSSDVRMKVSRNDTLRGKGKVLLAYEFLVNEVWIDTSRTPLSPMYFDNDTKEYTKAFKDLRFEEQGQFLKVATIHSFFINRIELQSDSITRKGEPGGRFAADVNEQLVNKYEIDLDHILSRVLSDLTTTSCATIPNPFCDPNQLKEKESTMVFDCIYTIRSENLGIGSGYPYRKGFRLEEQNYANNLTCSCIE